MKAKRGDIVMLIGRQPSHPTKEFAILLDDHSEDYPLTNYCRVNTGKEMESNMLSLRKALFHSRPLKNFQEKDMEILQVYLKLLS